MARAPAAEREQAALSEDIADFKSFRRTMHSKGDLFEGVIEARRRLNPKSTGQIVTEALSSSVYRNVIARDPFPANFGKLKQKQRFPTVADSVEASWLAAILGFYSKELSAFVELRDNFYRGLCANNYATAEAVLDTIEKQFGVSCWATTSRISLLQSQFGTARQKAHLQSVMQKRGINPYFVYIIYLVSYMSEENVSVADISRELAKVNVWNLSLNMRHYLNYHISPFELSRVEHPWKCASLEENSPIIDRFETFVEMAQLSFIRAPSINDAAFIRDALDLVKTIPDRRIQNLRQLFDPTLPADKLINIVGPCVDTVLKPEGASITKLQEILKQHAEEPVLHEVAARLGLKLKHPVRLGQDRAASNQLIGLYEDILGLTENYHQSRFALQKTALALRNLPAAKSIIAFLQSADDRLITHTANEDEAIGAMSGPLGDPEQLSVLRGLNDEAVELIYTDPRIQSTANTLAFAVAFPEAASDQTISAAPVAPEYRLLYEGHLRFNTKQYKDAFDRYQAYSAMVDGAERTRATRLVFDAAKAMDDLDSALPIYTDAYLVDQSVHLVFPLTRIAEWVRDNSGVDSSALNRAIVLNSHFEHVSTAFDGELSDAFEDVLDFYEVEKPSELLPHLDQGDRNRWIYFLRSICTVRRLEDSTRFHDYDEVESERLAILTGIVARCPELAEQLSYEIVELTKEREVFQLAERFDRSRIYVDEDGVKQFIKVELEDTVARYQRISNTPALQQQLEGIEAIIKSLLKDAGKEFEFVQLPASERETIFLGIHNMVMDSFVLNPDYGLKTYLTTRILHGSIEGELRSSFSKHGLLFSQDADREFDAAWKQALKITGTDYIVVRNAVTRLSRKVSDAILDLKDKKIRIRTTQTPKGLMDFEPFAEDMKKLQEEVANISSADVWANIIISYLWTKVDGSLAIVRREIEEDFRKKVLSAVDGLRTTLIGVARRNNINQLSDAVTVSLTEFQLSIEKVLAWFQRSTNTAVKPFTFDTAVRVAVRLTNSRFPTRPIAPKLVGCAAQIIRGSAFLPILDILRDCFQNAIEHAGFEDRAPETQVSIRELSDSFHIEIQNKISEDVDVSQLRTDLTKLLADGTEAQSVRRDGRGTGLRVIKRTVGHEGAPADKPLASVTDSHDFVVSFRIRKAD